MAIVEMPNEKPNENRSSIGAPSTRLPTDGKKKILFHVFLAFAIIAALVAATKVIWGSVRVILVLFDGSKGLGGWAKLTTRLSGSNVFGTTARDAVLATRFLNLHREAPIVFTNVFLLIAIAIGVLGLFTRKQLLIQVYLIGCMAIYLQNLDWIPTISYRLSPIAFLFHANIMALFYLGQMGSILAVLYFEV
ncbi:unnamed protein product, partial [Mesorhabditis belari]|uniref:Uncharacterized protein n=1 Tax=Mesorhabditis belari TaxID=2138241 RepID=A0AAF3EVB6_9BILA